MTTTCACETHRVIYTACAHTHIHHVTCRVDSGCCRIHTFDMRFGWCAACEACFGSDAARNPRFILHYWLYKERSRFRTPVHPRLVSTEDLLRRDYAASHHRAVRRGADEIPRAAVESFRVGLGAVMRQSAGGRDARAWSAATPAADADSTRSQGCDEGVTYPQYRALMDNARIYMMTTIDWARTNIVIDVFDLYERAAAKKEREQELEQEPELEQNDHDHDEIFVFEDDESDRGRPRHRLPSSTPNTPSPAPSPSTEPFPAFFPDDQPDARRPPGILRVQAPLSPSTPQPNDHLAVRFQVNNVREGAVSHLRLYSPPPRPQSVDSDDEAW